MLADTVGIKRTELEDKLLFQVFTAFCVSLMHGKATYRHVLSGLVRQIKLLHYRLRCKGAWSYNLLYQFVSIFQFIVLQFSTDTSPVSLEIIPTIFKSLLYIILLAYFFVYYLHYSLMTINILIVLFKGVSKFVRGKIEIILYWFCIICGILV